MPNPLTLVQLISEQTMQNLLPLLRLKPARLIHLATPKTAARSACIVAAARQAGLQPDVELITLSAMPAMPETANAIRAVIAASRERGETPVVNFTGGTKLMSIGAFSAALGGKVLSFYVDTEDALFVDGHTGEGLPALLENDFSFTPLRTALNVNILAVAHGHQRVTAGRDFKPLLPLAQHLLTHTLDEQAAHEALFGRGAMFDGGRMPQRPDHWLPYLDRAFHLPPGVAELAARAGLVSLPGGGGCRLPDRTRNEMKTLAQIQARKEYVADYNQRCFAASEPMQDTITFLTGGWWEIIVAEAASQSGVLRDIRWSARVGQSGGADLEEDILAVDGVQIFCVSCKRGGARARLLPLLEELNARARSIGGNFTRRCLAVQQPLKGAVAANLRQRASELGVRIITPADLSRLGAPGRL